VVAAECRLDADRLVLERFREFADWPAYELWLSEEREWVGGFDFPFGLPATIDAREGWIVSAPGADAGPGR